jgi:hypothetical protein
MDHLKFGQHHDRPEQVLDALWRRWLAEYLNGGIDLSSRW